MICGSRTAQIGIRLKAGDALKSTQKLSEAKCFSLYRKSPALKDLRDFPQSDETSTYMNEDSFLGH